MNRPRNRNNTPRGDRGGRGRGSGASSRGASPSYGPVPSAAQVVIGEGVSIVLKVDQPTGRQVQGVVGEVLGRGDHPRGIKVKLIDGRVGRVQRIVPVDEAKAASEGLAGLGRNGELLSGESSGTRPGRRGSTAIRGGGTPRIVQQDFRNDGYDYESREGADAGPSLMDYVKPKPGVKRKKSRRGRGGEDDDDEQPMDSGGKKDKGGDAPGETVTCPVCGKFEGDEEAVQFHVNSVHFG